MNVESRAHELVLARLGLPKDDPIAAVLETIEEGRRASDQNVKVTLGAIESVATSLSALVEDQRQAAEAVYRQNQWAFRWKSKFFVALVVGLLTGGSLAILGATIAFNKGVKIPLGSGVFLQNRATEDDGKAILIGAERGVERISRTPAGDIVVVFDNPFRK